MSDNRKPQFEIVKGDLPLSPRLAGGDFVRAEATDTRLMGVVGVHMVRQNDMGEYHQLFYLDFEEYGLDDYRSFQLCENSSMYDTAGDLENTISTLFGGLGGEWREITEREAIYLVNNAFLLNEISPDDPDDELPDGIDEYIYLLESPVILTDDEIAKLWHRLCPAPENDYEVINYFIMRAAAMDDDGIRYMSAPESELKTFSMYSPGSLYRNEITEPVNDKNSISSIHEYVAKSLISDDIGFRLIVSEISVAGPWVTAYTLVDDMRISPWESSLIMAQEEYDSLLRLESESSSITMSVAIKAMYENAELHSHPGGNLFMLLRKDNKHVARQVYRLDDDVLVSIYLRYNGEMVIASKDIANVERYEAVITELARAYNIAIRPIGRFAFPNMTLGHYVREDYGEFDSFLEYIQFLSNHTD